MVKCIFMWFHGCISVYIHIELYIMLNFPRYLFKYKTRNRRKGGYQICSVEIVPKSVSSFDSDCQINAGVIDYITRIQQSQAMKLGVNSYRLFAS